MSVEGEIVEGLLKFRDSTANFGVVYNDGTVTPIGSVCHGQMGRLGRVEDIDYVYTAAYPWGSGGKPFKGLPIRSGALELYIDYLLNRSPMSHVYLSKDGMDKGYVKLDLGVPSNLLMCALIVTRYPREKPGCINIFELLVKAGIPENAAFILMHYCGFTEQDGRVTFCEGGNFAIEHSIFNYQIFDLKCVGNYIHGRAVNLCPLYRRRQRYEKINFTFSSQTPEDYSAFTSWDSDHRGQVISLLTGDYVPSKSSVVCTNPFASKALRAANYFDIEAVVESFVKFYNDHLKELV